MYDMYTLSRSLVGRIVQLVVLDRSIGNIGMSIVGGADHTSKVFGGGQPGLYISKVLVQHVCGNALPRQPW